MILENSSWRSDGQTLDAMTAYTGQDEAGRYRFRVYERIQFVTREKSALLNLAFERVGEQAMKRGA